MVTERMADTPAVPANLEETVLDALDSLDAPSGEAGRLHDFGDGRFRLADAGQADWAARKLARARSHLAEVNALAARQRQAILDAVAPHLRAIDDWAAEETGRLEGEMGHWEALLAQYHRALLAEDPKAAKTIRLPHATLSARKQPDEWTADDAVLIEWAQKVGAEILRVKTEIDRREMKRILTVAPNGAVVWGGELVPGVSLTPGEVHFSVDTGEVAR